MANRTTVTMSPVARRALARRWFLAGFRHSGEKCNGETVLRGRRLADSPSFESLLESEFARAYDSDAVDETDVASEKTVHEVPWAVAPIAIERSRVVTTRKLPKLK